MIHSVHGCYGCVSEYMLQFLYMLHLFECVDVFELEEFVDVLFTSERENF